ncbi:MAG: TonB-dependent receptor [Opitutaceae bacterium]|nr:TonB-dependent receptor [Opitutaceae bacterium]
MNCTSASAPSCIPRNATLLKASALSALALLIGSLPLVGQQTTAPAVETKEKEQDVLKLDTFKVAGALQGQAKAIQGTKEATNLVNIISADKMGTFPDLNAAEALRRLPGVSMVMSGGEGRFVTIRGARPQYNGTLVNGFTLPVGDSEIRRNDLVTVSNTLIDTIVLTKTAMPDMPADGIGGTTNVIMRNPLDLTARHISGSVYYGWNENGGEAQDRENIIYGDLIGKDKKYAFIVSANHRLSDYYFTEYSVNQPVLSNLTGGSQAYLPQGFRYQLVDVERKNLGADVAFAARLGDNTRLVLRGFKSDAYQDEYTHRYTYSNILPVLSGGAPVDYTATGGLATTRLIRLWRSRTWWLTNEGVQFTGTTDLSNGIKLDYGFQRARSLERYENDLFFNGTNATTPDPIRVDIRSEHIKFFSNTAGSTAVLLDPATQRIATIATSTLRKDWETEKTPYINARKEFELNDGASFEIKSGIYIRMKRKANPNNSITYSPLSSSTLSFANLGNGGAITSFDDKGINLGVIPNPDTAKSFYANNSSSFGPPVVGILPGDVNMYNADEDISAGYVMGTYKKRRLTLIGGVRYEKTEDKFLRLTAATGGTYKEFNGEYDNVLPSAHVKFEIRPDMFIRASWANTVGRPDASNIYGVETINPIALTINQPNPGLEALESENIDLSFDWYSGPLGQFMVGIFTKDIVNFPLTITDQIQLNGQTYTRTSVQARATGEIKGFEASFRRNLDFLPGFLSGLGVDLNYAKLDSELQHATRTDRPRLPEQPDYIFNASVYYAYQAYFFRLAMSEEGRYITSVGASEIFDRLRDSRSTWDFTASYDFGRAKTYQAYFEWRNITNAADESHYNAGNVLATRTRAGTNIGGGFRFRF